jgi:hypothetical protein
MNYWLLIMMMLVAVLAVAVVLASDETAHTDVPLAYPEEREDPLKDGDH